MAESMAHRVVIVGGGFAGLNAAQRLRRAPVQVTLIDRRNFHLFQPLLYQVATGALSPANIAAPLRAVVRKQRNTRVVLGEVTGFDVANRQVRLGEECVPYDTLILATGATNHYFNHPEWEHLAPGLKSVEEATEIRARILSAFEEAERVTDPAMKKCHLTFVIVGGGPTGVEMAGAISELARATLRGNFRTFDPAQSRILVVEGHDRILPPFHPKLSAKAARSLTRMGVEIWTSSKVKDIQPDHVMVDRQGHEERVEASTVMWAAGVKGSPLGKALAEAAGATADRGGRVVVGPDLTVPGHPELFVIGDLAAATGTDGKPLPGLAPVAMQQGKYVAALIRRRMDGKSTADRPFRYWDKGTMATVGRASAVVDMYWLRFSGWFAWMTWLFVHIMYLIQFQNRLLVLFQWAWNYITRNRAARLITGEEAKRAAAVHQAVLAPPPCPPSGSDDGSKQAGEAPAEPKPSPREVPAAGS